MTIISSLNHAAADMLAAIVEQSRTDYIGGKEWAGLEAYATACAFFRDHPHIPIIPHGYQCEREIAAATGWTVAKVRQVCKLWSIRYREYAGLRYYMPAEIHRAAERKADAERGQG